MREKADKDRHFRIKPSASCLLKCLFYHTQHFNTQSVGERMSRQGNSQVTVWCHLAGPRQWFSSYEAARAAGDLHWASGGVNCHGDHSGARLALVAKAFSLGFGLSHYWLSSM